jgi:allophanate hydrolase
VQLAVVGAHLTGQPLNGQLTQRGARLQKICRTAPNYRLFALPGSSPPKPGLIRDEHSQGVGIEVEVWAMPEDQFGGFVAAVPPPLTIGTATLDSGESVKCFLCEPHAVSGALEITHHGGWRAYLSSSHLSSSKS